MEEDLYSKTVEGYDWSNYEIPINLETRNRLIANSKVAFEIARRITGIKDDKFFIIGGVIRDSILNRKSQHDFDIIGNFDLDKIKSEFKEFISGSWPEVNTIKLQFGDINIDFIFSTNIKETLESNDIDVSNLCLSPEGKIYDFVGGIESLDEKKICIKDAEDKINNDHSRIFRVFRFANILGFDIEEETLKACTKFITKINFDECRYEINEIRKLDDQKRIKIVQDLRDCGFIDQKIIENILQEGMRLEQIELEERLEQIKPLQELTMMFDCEIYLAGGATRDNIWKRNIKDLDLKLTMSTEEIVEKLKSEGYKQTKNIHLVEKEYYVNQFNGTVSIFIDGYDLDMGNLHGGTIDEAMKYSDLNFNCCVYDVKNKKVVNPELIEQIREKKMSFTNIQATKEDPSLILSALKQISRMPDIQLSEATIEAIVSSSESLIDYIKDNPGQGHKFKSILGNINTKYALSLIKKSEDIFDLIKPRKREIITKDKKYLSKEINEVTKQERHEIIKFYQKMYGRNFDINKLNSPKNTHVILEYGQGGKTTKIVSCIIMQESRIYGVAAVSWRGLLDTITSVVCSNNDIWCSIDSENNSLITLATMAGMRLESDSNVISKILVNTDEKYEKKLSFTEIDAVTKFHYKSENNYYQVLLRK